jgi:hypothetical protein
MLITVDANSFLIADISSFVFVANFSNLLRAMIRRGRSTEEGVLHDEVDGGDDEDASDV